MNIPPSLTLGGQEGSTALSKVAKREEKSPNPAEIEAKLAEESEDTSLFISGTIRKEEAS